MYKQHKKIPASFKCCVTHALVVTDIQICLDANLGSYKTKIFWWQTLLGAKHIRKPWNFCCSCNELYVCMYVWTLDCVDENQQVESSNNDNEIGDNQESDCKIGTPDSE